jgi:signal transduction histidine kinase
MAGSKVLIVDDEIKNIKLLKGILYSENYIIYEALNGEAAINLVHDIGPDLVLLDVMMPGLSGFEVCRRLKHDEKTKSIPIMMVTALREKKHRLKAMKSGADDFLSKPVDSTEVVVRVKSLLRIKSYYDEISFNYEEIAAKNDKLLELEKIKDGLVHMIVHDLRNPLAALTGYLDLALLDKPNLSERQIQCLHNSLESCQELNEMISGLLDIYRMEEGNMQLNLETAALESLIDESIQQFFIRAAEKQITIAYDRADQEYSISVDRRLLKRVFANLMNNAIRHTPTGGKINISVESDQENGSLRIEIRDNGIGLAPEYHQRVFDKFEQVKRIKPGNAVSASGLGLAFCKLAVEAHGGKIWVESDGAGTGASFKFSLPLEQTNELPYPA